MKAVLLTGFEPFGGEAVNASQEIVCNHVFYALMHRLARRARAPRAGFIHVPRLGAPEDAVPGLPLPGLVEAVRAAIAVCVAPATKPNLTTSNEPELTNTRRAGRGLRGRSGRRGRADESDDAPTRR